MSVHVPVLLQQVVSFLRPEKNQNFLDATAGEGGYIKEILKRNLPSGKVAAIDWNSGVLEELKKEVADERLVAIAGNFKNLDQLVKSTKIQEIHGAVFDLGLSRFLLEKSNRGFSFRKDEPLLMSYAKDSDLTAEKILNHYSEKDLERIFVEFGEERFAGRIAAAIKKNRPIHSSLQLARIVESSVPWRTKIHPTHKFMGGIHPATRIFQALRIEVNHEFENIKQALPKAIKLVKPGGRVVVISYHSLEDRIVKTVFREEAKAGHVKILTKKPVLPEIEEIKSNPSSRSAKLRAVEKLTE
ncbi:MAG: Ribosomal RNA small subunit methyltransferase H [Parcubacteria group bacterium GW2011_GWC1_45_9]|nr:MAG: Ribosomal RNA small subunit methyltransferase H [Parcubacteria group bacterium GW2011_GWC1_45_9]HCI05320.1 16S rRNA (cytosine(1402)-N(4))-methyltransferase [Patescibacteria group bacterium]